MENPENLMGFEQEQPEKFNPVQDKMDVDENVKEAIPAPFDAEIQLMKFVIKIPPLTPEQLKRLEGDNTEPEEKIGSEMNTEEPKTTRMTRASAKKPADASKPNKTKQGVAVRKNLVIMIEKIPAKLLEMIE